MRFRMICHASKVAGRSRTCWFPAQFKEYKPYNAIQMTMLELLRQHLQNGYTFARQKGQLGARVTRLRFEILSLQRQRETLFSRLGRAYHFEPDDRAALEPLRLEIDRLTQTIRDRESALLQLSQETTKEGPMIGPSSEL
jgi:hypothetical protein